MIRRHSLLKEAVSNQSSDIIPCIHLREPSKYTHPRTEDGWGKTVRLVHAFGVGYTEDVTSKYQ